MQRIISEMMMQLRGSDATDRTGAYWAISDKDLAARVLYQEPMQIPPGRALTVGLKQREVSYCTNLNYHDYDHPLAD